MRLSVIICCLNGERTIAGQLDALAAQKGLDDWEVVVSDNGSTDASRQIVGRYVGRIPNLRVVDSSTRRGIARAKCGNPCRRRRVLHLL